MSGSPPTVDMPSDVGTRCVYACRYGSLCALATFSRTELKQRVLDNSAFKEFLELYPEMREMVKAFASSRYALHAHSRQQQQPARYHLNTTSTTHCPDPLTFWNSVYTHCRYGACLKTMHAFQSELLLDCNLSEHVGFLYNKIREKMISQYVARHLVFRFCCRCRGASFTARGWVGKRAMLITRDVVLGTFLRFRRWT